MCVRISGRMGTCWRLLYVLASASQENGGRSLPVVRHVQNMFLGANSNLLENLLAGMLTDMVADHDSMRLYRELACTRNSTERGTCLGMDDGIQQEG